MLGARGFRQPASIGRRQVAPSNSPAAALPLSQQGRRGPAAAQQASSSCQVLPIACSKRKGSFCRGEQRLWLPQPLERVLSGRPLETPSPGAAGGLIGAVWVAWSLNATVVKVIGPTGCLVQNHADAPAAVPQSVGGGYRWLGPWCCQAAPKFDTPAGGAAYPAIHIPTLRMHAYAGCPSCCRCFCQGVCAGRSTAV